MNREQIIEDLSEYIAALTGTETEIKADTKLAEMDVDSISLVKIFVFIERTFGISLLDAGLSKDQIETFGSLVHYINQNKENH
jgi:acyl carrier protein